MELPKLRNNILSLSKINRIKRLRGRITADQDGVTLIELLLTMILTLIVMSVVPPLLMTTDTANTTTQQLAFGTTSASLGMETIDDYVGSATFICLPPANITLTNTSTNQGSYVVGNTGDALLAESDAFTGSTNPQWVEFVIPEAQSATAATGSTPISNNTLYWRKWSASAGNQAPANTPFSALVQPVYNTLKNINVVPFKIVSNTSQPNILDTNLYVGSVFKAAPSSSGLPTNIVNMKNEVAALNTNIQSVSSSTTTTTATSSTSSPPDCS
ncbi:MAG: prepilin-type N-terminal cleavage/methylation domain-containing protein [Firmicutes bacterium]|nr:prepilin-type N-terminal cleavage/methylation domain-containing protein [Bacillota bacterium]